ncbi:hypothetical protein D1872_277340 [compost metagenome]
MGRTVPVNIQAFLAVEGQHFHGAILLNRNIEVHRNPVDFAGDRIFPQTAADRLRHLPYCGPLLEPPDAAVR